MMLKQRLQRQSACLLPESLGFAAVALLQLCKCMYDCLPVLLAFCSHTGLPFIGVVTQAARDKVRDKGMHTRSSSDAKLELACCLH